MEKSILERFIQKYYLSGAAEAVTIVADKATNQIKTEFQSNDGNIVGSVVADNIELDTGEYPVYNTSQLQALLGVLGKTISITLVKRGSVVTGLKLRDTTTEVVFALADKINIPAVKKLKGSLPPFSIVIGIDETFISTFIKAKNAISTADTFTVESDGKKTHVILGDSNTNTNKIVIDVTTSQTIKTTEIIEFSAEYLKELLVANKEMGHGTMSVSDEGLIHIVFSGNGFATDYYLPAIANV